MRARRSGGKKPLHCWRCCAALLWRPRARRPGCSATIWLQTPASSRLIRPMSKRTWWPPSSCFFANRLFGHDGRAAKLLEHFGPVAIFVAQELVRDIAQRCGQLCGELPGVGARIFAIDRADGIHVLVDQFL